MTARLQPRVRLHRREPCVPGANVRMIEKAPGLGADVVMLDLEDAVAPDDKAQARENVIAAPRELDWSGCSASLRINGLATHYCYRDIVDVVEQSGAWLDTVLVPQASGAGDIHLAATLLAQIEDAVGLERRIGISALIEKAPGMLNVEEIAAACPERMEALIFGVADYAASMQSHTASIGGSDCKYAVLTDAGDDGGRDLHWGSGTTRWRASRSPAGPTGCGRWTAPAVSLDGRLIDAASLRMAEHLLAKIALIEERAGESRGVRSADAASSSGIRRND